jgi:hypothetical protein
VLIERKARYTIGQVMVVIAILACMMAVPQVLRAPRAPGTTYLLGLIIALFAGAAAIHAVIDRLVGLTCPSCKRQTLRRLARQGHYYRCSACRSRFKKFRSGPWLDASGPEDADKFRRVGGAGNWEGFESPRDLEGSTTGHLLKDKRLGGWQEPLPRQPHVQGPSRRVWEAERKVRRFLSRFRGDEDPQAADR